ncbi:MAG: hypothetical protein QGH15_08875 [Kiritimatiellia bacterium]|jgi:hypothetical protein|nr:hypothetical protein [Kiritimatiellia bacterium]
MKHAHPARSVSIYLLIVLMMGTTVLGQTRPRTGAGRSTTAVPSIIIRELDGLANRDRAETPVYSTSASSSSTREDREWGMVRVEYDTTPEWLDEVVVEYMALSLEPTKDATKKYTMYKKSVKYMDVKRDRGHLGSVFIRPSGIERYGRLVAVAVKFSVGGKLVAEFGESKLDKKYDPWWKNPVILESPAVTPREHYMLNRAESPFAFINMDDYEAIK